MRVAIDAGNFAVDRRGMGRVARAIAEALLHEPRARTTFLLEHPKDAPRLAAVFGDVDIEIEPASSASRRGRYDLVWFPWNGMRFPTAAPAVVTINDAFAFTHPARGIVARVREQAPIRRGARRARRIATCSRWSRDEIVRTLSLDPRIIEVIPNVPDAFFHPGPAPRESNSRYVLMVGVAEPRKNARVVIEACAAAFTDPGDTLVVVGDVAQDDAARLARVGLAHRVVRDTSDVELRELYRGARAVAVPSTAEGFGLVAVEAMACGSAALVANASALPEATEGAALLLEPLDVGAWRDAIARVLRDDSFATMLAARGAARFAHRPRTTQQRAYVELFLQVCEGAANSA